MRCHEIDYKVFGDDLQFVEVELDQGETVIAEAGVMMYMDSGINFEARMGDGSAADDGVFGKLMSVGKRVLTGESIFMTHFTSTEKGKQHVAFGAPYPGRSWRLILQSTERNSCAKKIRSCVPPRALK